MSARSTRAYVPESSNLRAKYERLGALLYEHERSDFNVHSNFKYEVQLCENYL